MFVSFIICTVRPNLQMWQTQMRQGLDYTAWKNGRERKREYSLLGWWEIPPLAHRLHSASIHLSISPHVIREWRLKQRGILGLCSQERVIIVFRRCAQLQGRPTRLKEHTHNLKLACSYTQTHNRAGQYKTMLYIYIYIIFTLSLYGYVFLWTDQIMKKLPWF